MESNIKKALWWMGEPNYGLLSTLLQQSGNGGTILKGRTIFNGITSGGKYQGSYSPAATYAQYDIIGYPLDASPLRYRANQSTSAGQNPDTHPAKWDLQVGFEFLQDLGGANYARYSLGVRNDAMIRLNGLEIGTIATTSFNRTTSFYEGFRATATIGTATTSITPPGSHPSARTLPTSAGLVADLPDSETLTGTCTDTFSIPATTPTFLTLTLPTGLTLTAGETITLYGNASNFVVLIVARYNSSTGAFYGSSTNSVGSGSFSSWTIKRERLVYIYDTTDSTGKNFYGLVQTYDNGTGSLVVNSVANVSTITNSDWTIAIAKRPITPSATPSSFFNNSVNTAYAVGHWMIGSFTGDRLGMNSETSPAGMSWEYVYLTGPDQDSPPANATVSTYSAGTVSLVEQTVFSGLTKGTHTFLAVSKVSASGTNTRAWIYADTDDSSRFSFFNRYEYDVFTPTVTPGPRGGESFGEIAYRFRDDNVGHTAVWLPEHSNVLTTFSVSKSAGGTYNPDLSDENDPMMLKFVDITTATLLQTLDIQHPEAIGSMGEMITIHSFDKNGLYYKPIITWGQAGLIEIGYNNMVFLGEAWFNKILCEDGQVITRPADNTTATLTGTQENQSSYLFYSTGADPLNDYVIGQYWPNKTRDWRIGGSNRGTSFMQDFTGVANAKFYPFVYSNYAFSPGEIMTVECRLYIGNKGSLVLS